MGRVLEADFRGVTRRCLRKLHLGVNFRLGDDSYRIRWDLQITRNQGVLSVSAVYLALPDNSVIFDRYPTHRTHESKMRTILRPISSSASLFTITCSEISSSPRGCPHAS